VKITVVVPVFYAEPRLDTTLERLAAVRERLDMEILIVVDVPDPKHEEEARAANDDVSARWGAKCLYRIGVRGFGSALRHGFRQATGEAVLPFMGDCSDDPEDIPLMAHAMASGADVVAGSRYMRGGGIVGMTPKQRVSRWYSVLVRAAGGPPIHDVSNAFKLYGRRVVDTVDSMAESFDISVELTVKAAAAGFRVVEIPTTWTNRDEGTSHFAFRDELARYGRWLSYVARHRRAIRAGVRPAVGTVPGGGGVRAD